MIHVIAYKMLSRISYFTVINSVSDFCSEQDSPTPILCRTSYVTRVISSVLYLVVSCKQLL